MSDTNKLNRLGELFGSFGKLAEDIGVDRSLPYKWRDRGEGVPTQHNPAIVAAAKRRGIDLEEVSACLDPHVCPCCNRPLDAGQALDYRRAKTALRARKK